jgi:hypothetical protein
VRIWTAVRCAHWSPVSDEAAVRLAQGGLLRAEDVDPAERPGAALALLGEGAGLPRWARDFAADTCLDHRERPAGCSP